MAIATLSIAGFAMSYGRFVTEEGGIGLRHPDLLAATLIGLLTLVAAIPLGRWLVRSRRGRDRRC